MYTFLFRQNQIGRHVPAIPETEEDDEEYGYERPEISGYGYTRDSNEYADQRGQGRGGRRKGYESGGQRQGYGQEEERGRQTVEEILQSSEEVSEVRGEEGACGPECRNLMHESEHPKEDDRCPYEGMVIDIWGYCRLYNNIPESPSTVLNIRYQFEEERRDWRWWETIRQYMHSMGNSW